MMMRLYDTALWLDATALSLSIKETIWAVPFIQSLHILALAVVFASACFVNVRFIHGGSNAVSPADTVRRFRAWIYGGVVVLAITGGLLVIGEPIRSLMNQLFHLKMIMLLILLAAMAIVHPRVLRAEVDNGTAGVPRPMLAAYGFFALLMWTAIIFCGRLIAYFG